MVDGIKIKAFMFLKFNRSSTIYILEPSIDSYGFPT